MKYNMNNAINAARNIVLNATMSELEMALHIQQYGIIDKDAEAEKEARVSDIISRLHLVTPEEMEFYFPSEETSLTFIPSKGWVKKQTRRGHILKDKAKAGYHHPRRWEGREYNRGKVEVLKTEAVIKANKLLLSEDEDSETTVNEGIASLWSVYEGDISKKLTALQESKLYHYTEWYTVNRIAEAEFEARSIWKELRAMEVEFYNSIDTIYPEEGMGWKKEVIFTFMADLYRNVQMVLDIVVNHLKVCIKDRIRAEMERLEDEMESISRIKTELDF